MTIDVSQVPLPLRSHPQVSLYREQARVALSNPLFVEALCIHEAAHMTYNLRAGISEFDFLGTRITYDGGQFSLLMAGIRPKRESIRIDPTTTGIAVVVCAAVIGAAGGVATRVLANALDVGDEADKETFRRLCNQLAVENWLEVWKKAEEAISRDLESEPLKLEIQTRAREIKPLLGL